MSGRTARRAFALAVILALPLASLVSAQTRLSALQQWQTGQYDEAIRSYQILARGAGAPPDVHRDLVHILLEVGRTTDAERHITEAGGGPQLVNVLGEAQLATGKWDAAEASFRAAIAGRASDEIQARINLAELLWSRGRHAEALRLADTFIDLYNLGGRPLSANDLISVGRAVRLLGVTNPQLFKDALLAFDKARGIAPGDPMPTVLAGELFLEKYNSTEAHAAFDEAIERNPSHPRALLGKARARDFDSQRGADSLTKKVLDTNPRSVAARTLRAQLALSAEDYETSFADAQAALDVNPGSLEALAILGAARYLANDRNAYEVVKGRALAINPRNADFFATVAGMAVQVRRYQEAVEIASQGVALDSTSWGTIGLLGMNQLRIGAIEQGHANIDRAFKGDPFNVWFKNTLDLLDTFGSYRTITTPHFTLLLRGDESDLLGPYVSRIAEEAYGALRAHYGVDPPTPIRLELFPRDADFSVRTLGLTGLGALGVTFGKVIVMDSPAAHEPGEFNWASTLWHEASHAFHLGMTANKVPRWFSEGLSVHEQRLGRPGWGHPVTLGFLAAYRDGKLPPASDLNRGFMHPDYPEEVIHSYFMASMVFAWMEQEHGKDASVRMLRGYNVGKDTKTLVREVLGLELDAFDKSVDAYIRMRFADGFRSTVPVNERMSDTPSLTEAEAAARRNPDSFSLRLVLGQMLFDEERFAEAEVELTAALQLFPNYAEVDGPYLYLARIHRERGETEKAAAALTQLGLLNESALEPHVIEATLRRQMGDMAGAALALEKAVLIHPYEIEVHEQLADLAASLGKTAQAAEERRAVVALKPVDMAGAHFRLARALLAAGQRDEARREVLRALEVAPSYQEAQDLLLELRASGASR